MTISVCTGGAAVKEYHCSNSQSICGTIPDKWEVGVTGVAWLGWKSFFGRLQ